MSKNETHAHGFAAPATAAPHLDTQTLGGDEGYFHTENAPTHATDGSATGTSPETPLVAASREGGGDGLDEMTKVELLDLADSRGVDVDGRASKAKILEALRGE